MEGNKLLLRYLCNKKIPILSSNKTGIEQGSTFGVVADFYVLGEMSGEMAVRILKENIRPEQLGSEDSRATVDLNK